MKVAIMQPYFFPYIGYWQLINAVDQFVVLNDVNYINRGWINRNRVLCQGKPLYIHIPLSKASQNKKINEIDVLQDYKHITKLLRTLENCYKKAPYFDNTFPFISDLLLKDHEQKLDLYLFSIIKQICAHIQISTPLICSSMLPTNLNLHGENRILNICNILGADEYYNAPGGKDLYKYEHFQHEGIKLLFLQTKQIQYQQYQNEFQGNLSLIDMMMFCSHTQISDYLSMYSCISEDSSMR